MLNLIRQIANRKNKKLRLVSVSSSKSEENNYNKAKLEKTCIISFFPDLSHTLDDTLLLAICGK
jgi:hypothetical protein